jgi:DNA-binding NarL/FixJ family response regulator
MVLAMTRDPNSTGNASILIAAQPNWRVNSLGVVLKTMPGIRSIGQVQDTTALLDRISEGGVDLVLLDASAIGDRVVPILTQIKTLSHSTACIVIVQYGSQQRAAAQAGADAVLFDGFRTEILAETIKGLSPKPVSVNAQAVDG